jgi:hypothetical protein
VAGWKSKEENSGEEELEESGIDKYIEENQGEIFKVTHDIEQVQIEHRGRKRLGKEMIGTEQGSDDGEFMGDIDNASLYLEDSKEDIPHKDLLEPPDNKHLERYIEEVNAGEANAFEIEDVYQENEGDSKLPGKFSNNSDNDELVNEQVIPVKEDINSEIQHQEEQNMAVEFSRSSDAPGNIQSLFHERVKAQEGIENLVQDVQPQDNIMKDPNKITREEMIGEQKEQMSEELKANTKDEVTEESGTKRIKRESIERPNNLENNTNIVNTIHNPALSEYTETLKEEPSDNQRTKEELTSSVQRYIPSKARSEEEPVKESKHWSELIKERLEVAISKKQAKEETNKEQSTINKANSEYSMGEDTAKDYSQLFKSSHMNILLGKYNSVSNVRSKGKIKTKASNFPSKFFK